MLIAFTAENGDFFVALPMWAEYIGSRLMEAMVNILLFNECLARPEGREYNKDQESTDKEEWICGKK